MIYKMTLNPFNLDNLLRKVCKRIMWQWKNSSINKTQWIKESQLKPTNQITWTWVTYLLELSLFSHIYCHCYFCRRFNSFHDGFTISLIPTWIQLNWKERSVIEATQIRKFDLLKLTKIRFIIGISMGRHLNR